MKAVFISDAHLKKTEDERYKKLLSFLDAVRDGNITRLLNSAKNNMEKKFIDDLYIAGDLFDFWFCRKEKINPEFKPVIDKLIELKQAGIRVHLGEGNHDFFMKEYFSGILGMDVFEEMTDVKMDQLNFLIAHGDTTDPSNFKYLLLRRILRSRFFYYFQRIIPSPVLWTLAGLSSTASKELTVEDGDALVKKMASFASGKFREGYDAVILGHSHVPGINHDDTDGNQKIFVTLGDWIVYRSFLYYEDKRFFLGYCP